MYCRQKIQKDFNSTVQNETEKTEKYGTGKMRSIRKKDYIRKKPCMTVFFYRKPGK